MYSFRIATQWQTRLSDLGYDSAVAQFSEPDGQGDSVLKAWYQGNKRREAAMRYSHTHSHTHTHSCICFL